MARLPKSPERKKLQGNTRMRGKVKPGAEIKAAAPETPAQKLFFSPGWEPAAWLPDGAKKIWTELLPTALRETKLQRSSLSVFATYCDAVYRMQKYTALIEKDGATYTTASGYIRKRPEVEMRDAAARDLRIYASELNLTPKSWINSMGTFSGRQLDMFMNGGRAASHDEPTPEAPGQTATPGAPGLDAFLDAKPTIN